MSGAAKAQSLYANAPTQDKFSLNRADTTFRLSHDLIIPGSESVYFGARKLTLYKEYSMRYAEGIVRVHLEQKKDSSFAKDTIIVLYNFLPFTFQSIYRHKEYAVRHDTSANGKGGVVNTKSTSSPLSNLFGNDLQKSGSIFRGFTVGTNQDLTVNSGFRLQFAGKLSPDVEILAALTDENTPIQPEGNTQTLQELDNVFVEVRSNQYEATLGDFYLDEGQGEFNRLSRKLQGAKGVAAFDGAGLSSSVTVSDATSRGKFNTNQFPGIEGVQGPYRLYGKNNENNIIIIAGTEKVYVDGNLMTRGETNDYSIDYSSSQITFSSRRLITGISRIVVDFQYTDQSYTRNFFSVEEDSKAVSDRLKFSISYTREGDDPSSPIDISLSDADKSLLAQSGGKIAARSGADSVGVDSLGIGRGQYAVVDSTIQGIPVRFYRFSPGTPEAQFNVSFTYVGAGLGDYTHQLLGQYLYVGPRAGDYLPIVVLPAPQLQQVADVNTSFEPVKNLTVTGEFAGSSLDPNRFAPGDAISGEAMKFSTTYSPKDVKIGGRSIGSFNLSLSDRYINKNFNPIDRIDEVEFGRKWSLDSTVNIQPASEEIREAAVTYNPVKSISVGGSLGSNEHGTQFSADRSEAFFRMEGDSLPKIDYTIEDIRSSQASVAGTDDWTRQKGGAEYALHGITPSFRFEREFRSIQTNTPDSLDAASFSFTTLAPKLTLKGFYGMNFSSELEVRDNDAPLAGDLKHQSQSITQTYGWALPETRNISSSVDVVLRKLSYLDQFRLANGDAQTILVRTESRYTPLKRGVDADVFYEASTERSAQLQRVFYQVQKGEGQYIWVDGNGNGKVDVTDERDFQLARYDGDYVIITVPTDQLYPVIDVKTSTRLRLAPAKFITSPSGWGEKALAAVSTESYIRIEEKSSDPVTRQIYLLDMSHFLNPATTILGSQLFQQDLFLFENRPDYSFRFRYLQRMGDGTYSTGAEQNYSRERSIRARFQFEPELSNQIDYSNKQDNLFAPAASGETRVINSDDISSDFSYRPEQNVEVGFKIEVSRSVDTYLPGPLAADLNVQSFRTVISFRGAGQIRFDLSREEILLQNNTPLIILPFELTGGRAEGKTFLWGLTFDYKLSGNLQSSVQYTGRSEPGRNVIHTAKAEVRAFF